MNPFKAPRFQHDCRACIWLGHYEHFDCWYCPPNKASAADRMLGGTVILRQSSEGSDYASMGVALLYRMAVERNPDVMATDTFAAWMSCLKHLGERDILRMVMEPNEEKIMEIREELETLKKISG